MNARLVPIAALLGTSNGMFAKATAGLTREQALARLGEDANPLVWVAAHTTTVRYGLAQLVGLDLARPWGARFGRGSEVGNLAELPPLEEVRAAWDALCGPLAGRIAQLTDAELDSPSPRALPIDDRSVLGAIAFLAYHEAYHIGQMALLRKAQGLGGLVG